MSASIKACLYSSVASRDIFDRVGFYRDDLAALKMGSGHAIATNSLRELMRFHPDIVVGYFFSKSVFAALIGRFIGARVLLTGGADQISPVLSDGYHLFKHRVLAFVCLLLAHRILLSCTDDFNSFRGLCLNFKFLEKKLSLVNHVVIPSPIPRKYRIDKGNTFSAFTLCWMGAESNARRKGVDRSIKLIALLRKIGVDASLDIAGTDGPGRIFIENLIRNMALTEHVHFLGSISEEDKNQRLSHGQVYIQLSEYEGFGVAAAEAFFSGMVVVHSNKGGLRDVIGHHGIILDAAIIEGGDLNLVRKFYYDFLQYRINPDFIRNNLVNYSVEMRSLAFFEEK